MADSPSFDKKDRVTERPRTEDFTNEQWAYLMETTIYRLEARCDANKNFAIGAPFARTIIHEMQEASRRLRAAASSAEAPSRSCWLVENGKPSPALRYRTIEQGIPEWTPDVNKAIRFARREDAEMFAAEDNDAWRIAEHLWQDAPPAAPSTERECCHGGPVTQACMAGGICHRLYAPSTPNAEAQPRELRGEARQKYIHDHDCPKAWEFFHRWAGGSKLCPSCLLCGHQAFDPDQWAIRHAELPDIYICRGCVDAARSRPSSTQRRVGPADRRAYHPETPNAPYRRMTAGRRAGDAERRAALLSHERQP